MEESMKKKTIAFIFLTLVGLDSFVTLQVADEESSYVCER